ncbi:uridine kinase [Oceanotoga sp. DSM 15011]|uniref:uridine/cytidine kinase n=1 Tax=Oceanotoga teriensis TaxID=515440 RepID=A0AA45C8U1_9BACT|nr:MULTISPECIES: uridine kinase [Oceanotoga]MDN5342059.1 uridine kinase [Oceanotoga sp.]MDO7975471.1 uridine kinase [Oceanotoga teriensis]PWJ96241.1 uridine kinase [Oceanotoga teriensis]UYP00025.1 uridine kinase [Oceanotoga sp. DSM 15011]
MVLVAIVGGSGSGKTSVSKCIVEHFKNRASLLNMDDYYKDLPPKINPSDFNFDDPKAFDFELFSKHMKELKNGKDIHVPVYNMVTFRRENGIFDLFRTNDLVIVEGIFVLHDDNIKELFDFSVYIDAPSDERLIRRIERDTIERGRTVESILKQYRKFVAPSFKSFIEPQKFKADIVLPEGVSNFRGMNIIINAIERMLETTSQEGDQ